MKNYKNLYTEEYFKGKKSFFSPKRKWLERDRDIFNLLEPNKKDVVLELGCSSGSTAKKISPHIQKVIAVDFAKEAIKLAEKEKAEKNIKYKIADAANLSFLKSESIDKITAIDFVEHIDDSDLAKVFQEAHRVLKPGGSMAIYTPQRLHWIEIIKHLLRVAPAHIGVRTSNKIIKMARNEGFSTDLLYFSPNPYTGLRWIDKILSIIPFINKFFQFRICLRLKKEV